MKKDNSAAKTADADIVVTGMHYSEIACVLKSEPGGEEVVANEDEQ